MSIRIMTKAWEVDVKGSDKLVLLALADNASDEGFCYPSWDTIMQKTGVSRGTLAKSLKTLEKLNLIKRISRKRENGSDASNGYFVLENIGQSSESEHQSKVQKLNPQSSESEHLEPSVLTVSINKKTSKKEKSLILDFYKTYSEYKKLVTVETLLDFIRYRREIDHAVKTPRALKTYVDALAECVKAGYDKNEVIDLMKQKEWRSIKLEWVKKYLTVEGEEWSSYGADYDDSKEWR